MFSLNYIRTLLAYCLAGFLVPYLWSYISGLGIYAGFGAGLLIIAPIWYIVHYKGLIYQDNEAATVDMGASIAIAVFTKDVLSEGVTNCFSSLPTIILLSIGAVLAALVSHYFERRKGPARCREKY